MLRKNDDKDQYLRHGGVMALVGCNDPGALLAAADDASAAVRMAVLLTYRRLGSAEVARFLNDSDPKLVLEAGRAINDVPIETAFPQLAACDSEDGPAESPVVPRRERQFPPGKAENAEAVAAFAARPDVPEALRIDALHALREWTKPKGRDRVMGLWRPLEPRLQTIAADAVRAGAGRHLHRPRQGAPGGPRERAVCLWPRLRLRPVCERTAGGSCGSATGLCS